MRYIKVGFVFKLFKWFPLYEKIRYKRKQTLLSFMDSIAKNIPHGSDNCVIWEVKSSDKLIAYFEFYKDKGYRCKLVAEDMLVSLIPDKNLICRLLSYEWEDSYNVYSKLMSM